MTKRLDSVAGEVEFDNLINSIDIPVKQKPVKVLSGQGKLKRGTALAINSAGKMAILGTSNCTANCILAEDVDATSADVQAMAFIKGHFNSNMLTVKADYIMSATDKENFRKVGILLSDCID